MKQYLLFVIVCKCNRVFTSVDDMDAWNGYAVHVPVCHIKTEAWSGWTIRITP